MKFKLWPTSNRANKNITFTTSVGDNYMTYASGKALQPTDRDMLKSYSTMPWLRAVTEKVGASVAMANWRIYEVDENFDTTKGYRLEKGMVPHGAQPVLGHDFMFFWENANPKMSGFTARKLIQNYIDLVGECYIFVDINEEGIPVEYWPLPRDFIEDKGGNTVFIKLSDRGERMEVPKENMIRFYSPDPVSPYAYSSAVGMTLAEELDTDESASNFLRTFFENDATPSAIVSMKGATLSQLKQAKNTWESKNRGLDKSHGVHFTAGDVEYKQIQQGLDQLRMVELRQYERDTIIQVFGVPPEMLGIIENSNRATIAGAEWIFAKTVVIPRLELICGEIQEKIINRFWGPQYRLGYESPLPDDETIRKDLMKQHPYAFRVNEIRDAAGLPPVSEEEGGDNFGIEVDVYAPTGASPTESAGTVEESPTSVGDGKSFTYRNQRINQTAIKRAIRSVNKRSIFRDANLDDLYRLTINEFGSDLFDEVTKSKSKAYNPNEKKQSSYLLQRLLKMENETFGSNLERALIKMHGNIRDEGLEDEDYVKAVADRYAAEDSNFKKFLIGAIATTELTAVSNFAREDAIDQSPDVEHKMWQHSGMGVKPRPGHVALSGEVKRVGEEFETNGHKAKYPGEFGLPEEDANCRCFIVPVKDPSDKATSRNYIGKSLRNVSEKYDESLKIYETVFKGIVDAFFDEFLERLG